jgi:hypothetical protein
MEDALYFIVGIAMYYSWGHFAVIQHSKVWKKRTPYQKGVTITALVFLALFVIGTLTN